MTPLDKVAIAEASRATRSQRAAARAGLKTLATQCTWLGDILQHHIAIEQAFAGVRAAPDPEQRRAAQRWLATLLTGHSMAEEAVLYPAMVLNDQKLHSTSAYAEQGAAKVGIATLETLDPMSQAYLDALEHVRGVVARHVHEEENHWYPALARQGGPSERARLSARYQEEFRRYMGSDSDLS